MKFAAQCSGMHAQSPAVPALPTTTFKGASTYSQDVYIAEHDHSAIAGVADKIFFASIQTPPQ